MYTSPLTVSFIISALVSCLESTQLFPSSLMLSFFGLFFGQVMWLLGYWFPNQRSMLCPLQWKQSPIHWTTKGRFSFFPFDCSIVDLQCCVHPSSFNIAYRQSMKWEPMFTNHLYNKGSRESPSGLMVRTQHFHYQGQDSIRGGQIEILQASENES